MSYIDIVTQSRGRMEVHCCRYKRDAIRFTKREAESMFKGLKYTLVMYEGGYIVQIPANKKG